jgi:hypothetical protein
MGVVRPRGYILKALPDGFLLSREGGEGKQALIGFGILPNGGSFAVKHGGSAGKVPDAVLPV